MAQKLVDVNLFGVLREQLQKSKFKLAVKSVGEAMRAIQCLTHERFYSTLLANDKKGIKYQVLINGRPFLYEELPTPENPQAIFKSELIMKKKDLHSIDIIPVIEGAEDALSIIAIVVGVILVATGIFAPIGAPLIATALVMGGLGLIAAGIINLLTQPPKFDDFRSIGGGGRLSNLFGGPQNVVGEGGPVPVLYGQLICGSQVVAASYEVTDQSASEELTI